MKKTAISLIRRTGSLEYTVQALQQLGQSLEAQLEKLGGNEKLEHLVRSWGIKAVQSP